MKNTLIKKLDLNNINLTKYSFFTGKGGVGKTSIACASAIFLADSNKKVLLVSTDPASNLQDVFQMTLTNKPTQCPNIPNLMIANFDPIIAAKEYMESVVGPYRDILPESAIINMEEQLSGTCTVEIAAFNEFTNLLTNEEVNNSFDYIIFDTAPTGHTLRMLELPSAWTNFIAENKTGVSCLGQLSGLEDKKLIYKKSLEILSNSQLTTLFLVTRPQKVSIIEAERSSTELKQLNIQNQKLIVNGLLEYNDDELSTILKNEQEIALNTIKNKWNNFDIFYLPLKSYNIIGIDNLRSLFTNETVKFTNQTIEKKEFPNLDCIVEDYISTNKKIILVMGKGGVGKTSIAVNLAEKISNKGLSVRLASTDPADHLSLYLSKNSKLKLSHINKEKELEKYKNEVISKAKSLTSNDLLYIEEDLKSPCTEEIAIFRAFAEIVTESEEDIIIIDTAPTGHTILLLESTQNYAKELERISGEIPKSIQKLLPRLQNKNETEVLMVTLPEITPVYESFRLSDDLNRANIAHTWWLINQSMYSHIHNIKNSILKQRSTEELKWIEKVMEKSKGKFAVEPWKNM